VTCSTIINQDNSIPQQSAEGTLVISATITPTNANNKLRIEFDADCVGHSSGGYILVALFQDATEDALKAGVAFYFSSGLAGSPVRLVHTMTAGTILATTFKIHIGPAGAFSAYVNADNTGTRLFGGVSSANLRITETKV
jgi:hypothetical protein